MSALLPERTAPVRGPADVVPDRSAAAALGGEHDVVPMWRTVRLDGVDPSEAMRRLCASAQDLRSGEPGFLLESAGVGGAGRWSTVGFRTRRLDVEGDPLPALGALGRLSVAPVPGAPPFVGGAVGYLGWEHARHAEPRIPRATLSGPDLPESAFLLVDDLVVFDHATAEVMVVTAHRPALENYDDAVARLNALRTRLRRRPRPERRPRLARRSGDRDWRASMTQADFCAQVRRAQDHIAAGEVFQIVLSQRFARPLTSTPLELYRALRATNPSPHLFLLCLGHGRYVVGASPEMLVRSDGRRIRTRPLAGTRPRGADAGADAALEAELRGDPKERAEHVMLVDLGRNDLGRVAATGSVRVSRFADVERYSHVMHLSSTVEGELADGCTPLDALRSTFPAGTLSGAPKIRAMELIAEIEGRRRGVYGGALGTVAYGGAVDTAIVLRTMVVADGKIHVQSGAGIVAASDPEAEYAETLHKAAALFAAADRAEGRR